MALSAARVALVCCVLARSFGFVTAVASGREAAVNARLVAIRARQGSMQSREIAAHLVVIEACRRKGPLRVTRTAARG